MKILHISDIHNFFEPHFKYDLDVDIIVCTGDAQCYTEAEFLNFVEWFSLFPILYKIYAVSCCMNFPYISKKMLRGIYIQISKYTKS